MCVQFLRICTDSQRDGHDDARAMHPDRTDESQPPSSPPPTSTDAQHEHGSLRGTFVAVVAMASFFVVTWFGMFLLAMDRR